MQSIMSLFLNNGRKIGEPGKTKPREITKKPSKLNDSRNFYAKQKLFSEGKLTDWDVLGVVERFTRHLEEDGEMQVLLENLIMNWGKPELEEIPPLSLAMHLREFFEEQDFVAIVMVALPLFLTTVLEEGSFVARSKGIVSLRNSADMEYLDKLREVINESNRIFGKMGACRMVSMYGWLENLPFVERFVLVKEIEDFKKIIIGLDEAAANECVITDFGSDGRISYWARGTEAESEEDVCEVCAAKENRKITEEEEKRWASEMMTWEIMSNQKREESDYYWDYDGSDIKSESDSDSYDSDCDYGYWALLNMGRNGLAEKERKECPMVVKVEPEDDDEEEEREEKEAGEEEEQ